MAQSHLDTLSGSQRIDEGLALLRQAWRDAVKGVGLVLSGIGLMLARTPTSALTFAGDIFRRVPGIAGAARWASQRLAAGLRALIAALSELIGFVFAVRTILWLLWAAVLVTAVVFSTPQVDWMSALGQTVAAIPAILIVVLGLGALVVVLWVFGRLFGWIGSLFTPAVLRALVAGVVIVTACAVLTILIASVSPPPLLAWVALAALFAGAAGIAVVSFGPTRFAAISLGGRRERQVPADTPNVIDAAFERADNATALPQPIRALDDRRAESAAAMRPTPPAFRPPSSRFMVSAAVGLALAVLGVLSALWFRSPNGTAQVQTLWAALQPATAAPQTTLPAHVRVAPPAPLANQAPQEGHALGLVADGRPGDVYWRSGYRALTARMDNGVAVQSLTLPPEACSAAAILVFGSASFDGAPELNLRLARHRALWAADWAREQLATCRSATSARTVIAISLGQAAAGEASDEQRRVRLIALGSDADGRAALANPDRLRQMSQGVLGDAQKFTAFEVCTVIEPHTATPTTGSTAWCS